MRKLLFFFAFFITTIAMAQVPQGLNYQAVVRDNSGALLMNHEVQFVMTIVKNTADNPVSVYSENHTVTTDDLGQVNFVIGQGTPYNNGNFSQVDWATGNTFLRIMLSTGGEFVNMGTTQFMSVPYAMFAGNSGSQLPNGTAPGEMLYWNGSQWSTIAPGTTGQTLTFCDGMPKWGPCNSNNKLAVPGNHQGWTPSTAPLLAPSSPGALDCEGYLWLNGGFKFIKADAQGTYNWGNPDYGDDGTFSGILAETEESDCTAAAGFYLLKANTQLLTYSTAPITMGVIGSATVNGWENSVPLTYDNNTKKWTGTLSLTTGALKFRANNAWEISFGDELPNDGVLDVNGADIIVSTPGTYLISLDMTTSRHYTYTITLQ